jgi:hypothetical protein
MLKGQEKFLGSFGRGESCCADERPVKPWSRLGGEDGRREGMARGRRKGGNGR